MRRIRIVPTSKSLKYFLNITNSGGSRTRGSSPEAGCGGGVPGGRRARSPGVHVRRGRGGIVSLAGHEGTEIYGIEHCVVGVFVSTPKSEADHEPGRREIFFEYSQADREPGVPVRKQDAAGESLLEAGTMVCNLPLIAKSFRKMLQAKGLVARDPPETMGPFFPKTFEIFHAKESDKNTRASTPADVPRHFFDNYIKKESEPLFALYGSDEDLELLDIGVKEEETLLREHCKPAWEDESEAPGAEDCQMTLYDGVMDILDTFGKHLGLLKPPGGPTPLALLREYPPNVFTGVKPADLPKKLYDMFTAKTEKADLKALFFSGTAREGSSPETILPQLAAFFGKKCPNIFAPPKPTDSWEDESEAPGAEDCQMSLYDGVIVILSTFGKHLGLLKPPGGPTPLALLREYPPNVFTGVKPADLPKKLYDMFTAKTEKADLKALFFSGTAREGSSPETVLPQLAAFLGEKCPNIFAPPKPTDWVWKRRCAFSHVLRAFYKFFLKNLSGSTIANACAVRNVVL